MMGWISPVSIAGSCRPYVHRGIMPAVPAPDARRPIATPARQYRIVLRRHVTRLPVPAPSQSHHMLSVVLHRPVRGSYTSAKLRTLAAATTPPAMRTAPSGNNVATW